MQNKKKPLYLHSETERKPIKPPNNKLPHTFSQTNTGECIPLKQEMRECINKVVIAGVNNDSVSQMTDNYLLREKVPNKDGVAFFYKNNEIFKFKTYRYSAEVESDWLEALLKKYI